MSSLHITDCGIGKVIKSLFGGWETYFKEKAESFDQARFRHRQRWHPHASAAATTKRRLQRRDVVVVGLLKTKRPFGASRPRA